jgi:glycogen debranching enzyme
MPAPSELKWVGDPAQRFFSSNGQRGFLFTVGGEGSEGYIYPFRVFHDLRPSFRVAGSDAWVEGRNIIQPVQVTPSEVTREYAADGLRVRETLFVPIDQAALILLYEVESPTPVNIRIAFRPDLDLMWPAGIGGQEYSWDDSHHAFHIHEPSDRYHALIGSPAVVAHSDPRDRTKPWDTEQVLSFEVRAEPNKTVAVVATIGMPKGYNAAQLYDQALKSYPEWRQQAGQHYTSRLSNLMQVRTGDAQTDQALQWAEVALLQAQACNPDLGCGLVAGYGPTWPTRRPQYAWFFGGDALTAINGLEAIGAHAEVDGALSFLRQYQDHTTGALWHEISQSAAYLEWFSLYPYAYRHTDISASYLAAMGDIWKSSGDRALLETSWPSLQQAWRFCLDHLDRQDGLLVIPADQSGVNESEFDRTEKELPLELAWVAGAKGFSDLAAAHGDQALSDEARHYADHARASLAKFWDADHSYYFEGLLAGGRPFKQQMLSPIGGVSQRIFPSRESELVLDRASQPAFLTAWGVRSVPSDDPHYEPDSYAHGSVWPFATAEFVLAALAVHRPELAWPMWHALVEQTFLDTPGHIPEVLSGASYRPLDVSVPEQTFSSAALVSATVRGVLGIEADAPSDTLRFAPHLPPAWTTVTLRNVRLGPRNISLTMQRTSDSITLSVANDGQPFQLEFVPMISGATSLAGSVDGKQVAVAVQHEQHDAHAALTTTVDKSAEIRITIPSEAQ